MSARAKEPTTRAGILAAGLAHITRTPAELEAAGAWWSAETHADRHDPDAKRARSEGLRAGLPHWLRPPVTPRDAVARMFKDADSERKAACEYVGGRRVVVVSEMTPTQLRAALGTQLRRLSGQWGDDKALDVTVEAPDSAAVLEPQSSPAPTKVRKARTPVPRRPKRPAAAPEPPAVSSKPATAPTPQRSTRPGKRDRLAWVPIMQRLATLYALPSGTFGSPGVARF